MNKVIHSKEGLASKYNHDALDTNSLDTTMIH